MKTTGVCPKCGGDDVHTNDGVALRGDRSVMGGAKSTHRLFIHAYVCLSCGYLEEHLTPDTLRDDKKMSALRATWRKVSPG